MADSAGIVIVGAGEAGARAASALREVGFAGPVTLVGDEPHPPYERPPLSKALLTAAEAPAATTILDEERLRACNIAHIGAAQAVAIDRAAHRVTLNDGRELRYERLLIATGAQPRRLGVPGAEAALYLRTFADALALRAWLRPEAHLVVIGGGFIGLEVAASAVSRGLAVTVVEAGPRLLARGVPSDVAERVADRHRAAGVNLHLSARIEAIARSEAGLTVALADGTALACDTVVVGIGAIPEVALAASAGLTLNNGIAVDTKLRTDDPDIFAAGDCCSFPHPLYGGRRVRLEAWRNAQDHGQVAARNLAGESVDYDAVPWFWSDQYDLALQIAGLPDEGSTTVVRHVEDDGQIFFHLAADGRLVAASGIGKLGRIAREIRLAEMLIARRAQPSADVLADASVKLKALLTVC